MIRQRPILLRLCPPISMSRAAVPPTNCAAGPYGPAQGVYGWVWRWFACLGRQKETHKKIENHGALDLGGRHLMATHNNQPIVGGGGRGDVGEKAIGGKSVWEGVVPLVGATI